MGSGATRARGAAQTDTRRRARTAGSRACAPRPRRRARVERARARAIARQARSSAPKLTQRAAKVSESRSNPDDGDHRVCVGPTQVSPSDPTGKAFSSQGTVRKVCLIGPHVEYRIVRSREDHVLYTARAQLAILTIDSTRQSRSRAGQTALDIARQEGRGEIAQLLEGRAGAEAAGA